MTLKTKNNEDMDIDLRVDFSVCKATRPILSVSELGKQGIRTIFHDADNKCYLEKQLGSKTSRIPLRQIGPLYFLNVTHADSILGVGDELTDTEEPELGAQGDEQAQIQDRRNSPWMNRRVQHLMCV